MELYRNWVWKCDYVCQGTGPQEDMRTHTHKASGRARQADLRMDSDGRCASWLTEETGVCVCVCLSVYSMCVNRIQKTERENVQCQDNHCALYIL